MNEPRLYVGAKTSSLYHYFKGEVPCGLNLETSTELSATQGHQDTTTARTPHSGCFKFITSYPRNYMAEVALGLFRSESVKPGLMYFVQRSLMEKIEGPAFYWRKWWAEWHGTPLVWEEQLIRPCDVYEQSVQATRPIIPIWGTSVLLNLQSTESALAINKVKGGHRGQIAQASMEDEQPAGGYWRDDFCPVHGSFPETVLPLYQIDGMHGTIPWHVERLLDTYDTEVRLAFRCLYHQPHLSGGLYSLLAVVAHATPAQCLRVVKLCLGQEQGLTWECHPTLHPIGLPQRDCDAVCRTRGQRGYADMSGGFRLSPHQGKTKLRAVGADSGDSERDYEPRQRQMEQLGQRCSEWPISGAAMAKGIPNMRAFLRAHPVRESDLLREALVTLGYDGPKSELVTPDFGDMAGTVEVYRQPDAGDLSQLNVGMKPLPSGFALIGANWEILEGQPLTKVLFKFDSAPIPTGKLDTKVLYKPNYMVAPVNRRALIDYSDYSESIGQPSLMTPIVEMLQQNRMCSGTPFGQGLRYMATQQLSVSKPRFGTWHRLRCAFPFSFTGDEEWAELKQMLAAYPYLTLNYKASAGLAGLDMSKGPAAQALAVLQVGVLRKQIREVLAGKEQDLQGWLQVEAKPKLDLYPNDKVYLKSRTIFNPSLSSVYLGACALAGDIWKAQDPDIETPNLLGVDPREFLRSLLDPGVLGTPGVHWWAYSDNLYGLEVTDKSAMWYSFDGVTMEAQISRELVASYYQSVLTGLNGEATFFVRSTQPRDIGDLTRIASERFPRSGVNVSVMEGAIFFDWEDENILRILSGQEVVESHVELLEEEQAYKVVIKVPPTTPSAWLSYYFTSFLPSFIGSASASSGDISLPVNFMPSGMPYTSQANTILTLTVIDQLNGQGIRPTQFAQMIKDNKAHDLGSWTVESEVDLSAFRGTPRDGYYKVDFLGHNVRVVEGAAFYELRDPNLAGILFYYKSFVERRDVQNSRLSAIVAAVNEGALSNPNLSGWILDRYIQTPALPVIFESVVDMAMEGSYYDSLDFAAGLSYGMLIQKLARRNCLFGEFPAELALRLDAMTSRVSSNPVTVAKVSDYNVLLHRAQDLYQPSSSALENANNMMESLVNDLYIPVPLAVSVTGKVLRQNGVQEALVQKVENFPWVEGSGVDKQPAAL